LLTPYKGQKRVPQREHLLEEIIIIPNQMWIIQGVYEEKMKKQGVNLEITTQGRARKKILLWSHGGQT
jgi:hypothetical protein